MVMTLPVSALICDLILTIRIELKELLQVQFF